MAKKLYCNEECKESYKTDRSMGLIYGLIGVKKSSLPKGFTDFVTLSDPEYVGVGWEDGCKILNACRYCFTEL